jgi:hypothetical protein
VKFEREPSQDPIIELPRFLEAGFEAIEKLSPADLKQLIGKHLSASRLKLHAKGKINFAAVDKENIHLSLCDDCADKALRLEREHVMRLQQEKGTFTISQRQLNRMDHGQQLGLIECRSFRLGLTLRENDLFWEIEADDPADIDNLRITNQSLEKNVAFTRKVMNSCHLMIGIGPVLQFCGQQIDISFRYQEACWSRSILIK